MTATATQNYLGRCREEGCEYVLFSTPEDVQDANGFRDVTAGTGAYRVNSGIFARCINRHKVFPLKRVEGTFSKDHQCDSRCLNARGWKCTCSCGGANHGRGHVATVTNAADVIQALVVREIARDPRNYDPRDTPHTREDYAAPAPILKHLGTVGEHITGEVFVKAIKRLENSTVLYSFRAVDGGHHIKWFCPGYADPEFTLGSTVKIRAKVKRHDEFMGAPETIVIYVEEVE